MPWGSHPWSATWRPVTPSATTARIRGSEPMAAMACSPPIDSPSTAISPVLTPGCRARYDTAAAMSRPPHQPKSIACPPERPWPRVSTSSAPYPCRASTAACPSTAVRVDPAPGSSTTAAPLRAGRYQADSRTPSAARKATSW